ncbi:unnamed protein product [Notodromas monacha]|uniref:N-acetylgalactosamine kinase n=1 Tax=Notodromas monacha TaxID=399045 RepID=A0A7R9BV18_9CRUS|nr:unnamed protein product [Notodromas monacha]CAG0921305.1 unnamed protein product [Notodromas monacha]
MEKAATSGAGDNKPLAITLSCREQLKNVRDSSGICDAFKVKYKENPEFLVHAPGRVNIVGEHIDYCGYAVFPMALEQGILIAASKGKDDLIHLANIDEAKYLECAPFGLSEIRSWTRGDASPKWQDYVKCGFRGIMNLEHEGVATSGFKIMVGGNLPAAAGVSSSSALVIASALLGCVSWNVQISRTTIAEVCAKTERYVGTEGGGMDQAISVLAEKGNAMLVEFNPLRSIAVRLPGDAIFVVCNSMVTMEKAATVQFNTRVAECRLACQILAKRVGLDWKTVKVLKNLQSQLGKSLAEMIQLVQYHLKESPHTLAEICDILGTTPEVLKAESLNKQCAGVNEFKLFQRATHVFEVSVNPSDGRETETKAGRVLEFRRICECEDSSVETLVTLGTLMNESHVSCRDLYQCSHEKLDKLQDVASKIAFGARLTGAGWGGCLVALVPREKLDEFRSTLETDYYEKLKGLRNGRSMDELVFTTAPAEGAMAYHIQGQGV